MKKRSTFLFVVVLLLCFGCEPSKPLPATTPGGGFFIQTFGWDQSNGGTPFPAYNITIHGDWVSDGTAPVGDPSSWTLTSGANTATILVVNGRISAYWNLSWESPSPWAGCASLPTVKAYLPFNVPNMDLISFTCVLQQLPALSSALGFTFTPTPTYIGVTNGTISANGNGFKSTYGMPLFQYFDNNGNLVAKTTATSVATDGSTASGPVPSNIGSVPGGVYVGLISNANASGGYSLLGSATMEVAGGGVFIDGSEQSYQVCHRWLAGGDCQQWITFYDYGTVSITINGVPSSVSYGSNDTPSTIATNLANAINANTSVNGLVTAFPQGTTVLVNVNQPGSQYSLSAVATSGDTKHFPDGSFSASASSSTL